VALSSEGQALPFPQKARAIEEVLLQDICVDMGASFDPRRFVPFVVMHEFEGLLFSDCAALAGSARKPDIEPALQAIRNQFDTPEAINDSARTAPSKRLTRLIPGYQKPTMGFQAALKIGLPKIADECPHFRNWLTILESRATSV
jgi:hypothetical protein